MTLAEAVAIARSQTIVGRSVGYTAGVFDLFHCAHRTYLAACKLQCDFLIVGVDSDALVKQKKGDDRPLDYLDRRLSNVLASGSVGHVFAKTASADEYFAEMRPSKYFVPDDRPLSNSRLRLLTALNIELVVIPRIQGTSTTELIRARRKPPFQ